MKFVMADGSTNTTTTKARKLAQTNWVCGCCAVLGAGQRTWFIVMLLCDIHINALPHVNRSYANGSKNTTKYTSQTKHWRHNDVRVIIRRRKKKNGIGKEKKQKQILNGDGGGRFKQCQQHHILEFIRRRKNDCVLGISTFISGIGTCVVSIRSHCCGDLASVSWKNWNNNKFESTLHFDYLNESRQVSLTRVSSTP